MTMILRLSRLGLIAAAALFLFAADAAHAQYQGGNQGGNSQGGGRNHGGPGPIVGAGLPAVLLIGGGAYLVLRRSKRARD